MQYVKRETEPGLRAQSRTGAAAWNNAGSVLRPLSLRRVLVAGKYRESWTPPRCVPIESMPGACDPSIALCQCAYILAAQIG